MRIPCIILSVFLPQSVIASCFERLTHGYRMDSSITELISDIGVNSCIKECLLRKPHCQSINYNSQHFKCGLNSREADDIELEGVPDYNSVFAKVVTDSLVWSSFALIVLHYFKSFKLVVFNHIHVIRVYSLMTVCELPFFE